MTILVAPTTRLSKYGEDVFNHGIYNLHTDGLLTGAIKAIIVISTAVSTSVGIKTSVDTQSLAKAAVTFSLNITPAVRAHSHVTPAVSSILQLSYPNEVSL